MDHFRSTYNVFIKKLIQRNRREIRLLDLKALLFLNMDIVFVFIGLVLAGRVDVILAEIISAVGSFSMWSAAYTFIETVPTLRYKDKLLKLYANAEIFFNETGE